MTCQPATTWRKHVTCRPATTWRKQVTCRLATTWRKVVAMGASPWNTDESRERTVKSRRDGRCLNVCGTFRPFGAFKPATPRRPWACAHGYNLSSLRDCMPAATPHQPWACAHGYIISSLRDCRRQPDADISSLRHCLNHFSGS